MSSSLVPSSMPSKSVHVPAQIPSPSQSQFGSSSTTDGYPSRRSGSAGSFGAGSTTRGTLSSAKGNQSFRKQHKTQRRPRLADEDAVAESAAMTSTRNRKGQTSITHLMNFTLPPRPQYHHHFGRTAHTRRNPTWGLGSGYHAIDKARYVHANYRFIVDPRSDYHAQAVDADVHLDWNNVLQILASAQSQSASCPICLSTPIAPRMAKCGHIFCLPCLIRYMHSTDDTQPLPERKARWKKCPICYDSVYISETRSVRWFLGQEVEPPREGDDIVLRLITRQPGSTLALPRDGAECLAKSEYIPWYFAAEVTDYARIMKGSEDYMVAQFDDEIETLKRQEKEDDLMFGEDNQWSRKAIAGIYEAKERVKGIGNPPSAPKQPPERKAKRPAIQFNESHEGTPEFYHLQHAAKSGQSSSAESSTTQSRSVKSPPTETMHTTAAIATATKPETLPADGDEILGPTRPPKASVIAASVLRLRTGQTLEQQQSSDSAFYFYQALLHYYLSPLDIRILKAAFGDFACFPATILPRVERVSTGHIVDDELRRRAKYLAHLPHGCEVSFLECNWTDVVVPEVLEGFSAEIERRRKKNMEKDMREEKERARAEKDDDDKRWATARRKTPIITLENLQQADFQPLKSTEPASTSVDTAPASSSPPWPSRNQIGSSFASLASPSTSPSAPRTVWGTTAIIPSSPPLHALPQESESSENNDGWLQDWEQDLLQEDDLVEKVQASSISENSSTTIAANTATGLGTGKKKKSKKITLMTTNARRGA